MKIYSRTGDKGETGLIGGARVSKTDPRIEAVGSLDEVNASLGLARASNLPQEVDVTLDWVQCKLFDVGAELATDGDAPTVRSVGEADVQRLEQSIDAMTAALEPLRNFILPGGLPGAAALHLSRTVCRRAERRIIELHALQPVAGDILRFVNRLSDWLFVAARFVNREAGVADVVWKRTEEP